jgi:hypothetical protein
MSSGNIFGNPCSSGLRGVSDYYTKDQINSLLLSKANTSNTYTRLYLDGQFSTLQGNINSLNSSKVSLSLLESSLNSLETEVLETVSGLYYPKEDLYTKPEIDLLLESLDLDPDSYVRIEPENSEENTIYPGSNNATPLTLRGSSNNAFVQRWLANNTDLIGHVSNNGSVLFERELTLGRLVPSGGVALNTNGKRITNLGNPQLGVDAIPYNFMRDYVSDVFQVLGISNPLDPEIPVALYTGPMIAGRESGFGPLQNIDIGTNLAISSGALVAVPSGVNGSVQFNDEGVYGGNDGLIYDKDTYLLISKGNVHLTEESSFFKIGSGSVLSSTTLGPGVVNSSLTSVGTLTSGALGAGFTPLVDSNISATAEISVSKLANGSARQLLQTDSSGTGVEWTSNIDIPGTLDVTGTATFDGAVTITGDLTINGTTTNINTVNLVVEDKNIVIGDVSSPTDITADGGGITLKGATDKTFNWVDSTDAWTSSEHINLLSTKGYYINGNSVLTSNTLGAGVTISSLTSVGTITTGTWSASTISVDRGGTGQTSYVNGELLIGNTTGNTLTKATLTAGTGISITNAPGSITLAVDSSIISTGQTGTVTSTMILNGTILDEDINANAGIVDTKLGTISTADKVSLTALNIDGGTDINAALADVDLIIVDDGGNGTNRKASVTRITDYAFGKVSGDITISSTGTAAISSGVIVNADVSDTAAISLSKLGTGALPTTITVASANIVNGTIVNEDISNTAAIAHSKLATLNSAHILLGNSSNVPTATSVTGDITISNSGVTSISSGVIVDSDISATAEISVSKLADGTPRQLLQTDAAGTGVEWTSNVDIPGTLDVTGTATFDSTISVPLGSAAAPSIFPGADTNTGVWSPGPDELAISTNGTERARFSGTETKLTTNLHLEGDVSGFTTSLQLVTPTSDNIISFPDATGTVGLVGGSNGQIIRNLNGAYAGVSSLTVNDSGCLTTTANGAASTSPIALTGTWFTGGTSTTTKPALLIEPTGATSTAWSTSGTGLGINAPSGFTGNLLDLQLNGVSRFRVNSSGEITGNLATTTTRGLQPASGFGTITYGATVNIDLATLSDQINTITLTGNLELTTSNLANGRRTGLRLIPGASGRTLTFPIDWKFVSAKPATLPANKVARLSIECHGTTNADVIAAIAIQP